MVPLFGVVAALALALLTGLSLPDSSPPAEGPAVRSVVVLWALAVALTSAGAWWGALASRRARWAAAVLVTGILGGVGVWVARRFDLAWIDSCWYGTGSGDRCLTSDGSAPTAVIIVWPLAALLLGATVGLGAALASSAALRRDMSARMASLRTEVLSLPADDRAALAADLLASLDDVAGADAPRSATPGATR